MLFAEKYVDADWNAAKEFVRREAKLEGISEGIREEKRTMSVALFKKGIPLDVIAECAKVSVEEVRSWLEEEKCEVKG